MAGRQTLLITGDFTLPVGVEERLSRLFLVDHMRIVPDRRSLVERLRFAQYYLLGGPEYVDAVVLDEAQGLRALVVMGTATGSFLDVEAALKRGIVVRNTPGLNAESVAEFGLGMIIVLNAGTFRSAEGVASGAYWDQPLRPALDDASIGLFGMGRIGEALARRLRSVAPSSRLMYWSRTRRPGLERDLHLVWSKKEDIFRSADICSIQLAYDWTETHHIIGNDLLKLGRGRLKLLNMANPHLIDPAALREALVGGDLAYAAIDGYYNEWVANRGRLHDEHRLLDLAPWKFVATSHIAALSIRAVDVILEAACRQLEELAK